MTPVSATRTALAALADAGPAERPAAFAALTDACNGLAVLVNRMEAWLAKEDDALTELEQDGMAIADSAFEARREKWIANVRTYETARDALGEAAVAVTKGEPA